MTYLASNLLQISLLTALDFGMGHPTLYFNVCPSCQCCMSCYENSASNKSN